MVDVLGAQPSSLRPPRPPVPEGEASRASQTHDHGSVDYRRNYHRRSPGMTSTSCADCARCPPAASSWPLPLGRPRAPTAGSTHAQWGSPRRRWWRVSVERAAGRVAGQGSTLVRVRHARGWLHTAHLVDRGTIYCLSRMGAKFGIPVLMAMFKDVPSHNEGGLRPGASVCCTARARPPHHRLAEPGRGRTGERWRAGPPAKLGS